MRGIFSSVYSRRGLTLVDVLVVLFVCVMLIGITTGVTYRARESSGRVKCASNLRQIGQALLLYANANRGAYPRTTWNPTDSTVRFFTGVGAAEPFGMKGPLANDVTAPLFLLMRTQNLIPDVFTCPSGLAKRWDFNGNPAGAKAFSNFPSDRQLGYSIHNPYPGSAMAATFKWETVFSPDFVLMADMNAGSPELTSTSFTTNRKLLESMNSYNHNRDGQNFLGGDGHAEFVVTPYCGIQKDNIYTFGGPGQSLGIFGAGVTADDSIVLPVGGKQPFMEGMSSRVTLITITAIIVALAILYPTVRRRMARND